MNDAACLRHDAAMRWMRGFHSWEREFLELNFINSEYFLRISKGCGLAFNIFLADVSQLYHIDNIRHFRRQVPKNINHDG